jgi:diguanylate cyclase (GGDEF)-like protein/PAS domain S-box-containing protein
MSLAIPVVVGLSLREHRPSQVLPLVLFALVPAVTAFGEGIDVWADVPGLADTAFTAGLYVVALVCWCVGAVLLLRSRSRIFDRYLVLDLAVFLVAIEVAVIRLLVEPALRTHPPVGVSTTFSLTCLTLDIAALVFTIRYFTIPGPRPRALKLLIWSLVSSVSILGTTSMGDFGVHLSLFWTAVLYTAALTDPTVAQLTEPAPSQAETFSLLRVASIGVALVLSPLTAWIVHLRTDDLDAVWFLAPTVVVTVLVLLRLQMGFRRERDAAAKLEHSKSTFEALLYGVSDVIIVVSPEGTIVHASAGASGTTLGRDAAALLGSPLRDLFLEGDHDAIDIAIEDACSGVGGVVEGGIEVHGAAHQFEVSINDRRDNPYLAGFVVVLHDVTERKLLEARLRYQALHDSLTTLPNRALLADRLSDALHHHEVLSVVYVDLDDFKAVNDGLGHAAGDRLLQAVAERLATTVRGSDTVARLGGDEFAILVLGDHAEEVSARVLDVLRAPFDIAGHHVTVSASVGVASAAGTDPEELLRNADVAMYEAKGGGKGAVAVFEQRMAEAASERLLLQMDLTDAVAGEQFRLVYQPVFNLADGRMTGAEALLRWDHPTRGRLAPDRFIGLAESSGLIVAIGAWVLRDACLQASAWPQHLDIAVNLSARQLERADIVDHVRAALDQSGLEPRRLVLEITETMLAQDPQATAEHLHRLTALGVRIAIDDFGTGYSSLSTLSRYPVHVLKIDRSFIGSMLGNDHAVALVQALVEMGRALQLQVVAEGIEDAEQAAVLRQHRCEQGQGFYFARPIDAAAFTELLEHEVVPG